MAFQDEVETRHKELLDLLESIDVDKLNSTGLSISLGGKVFKFKDVEVTSTENIEEKIKREYKQKLNDQQQVIREKINQKINQLLVMHNQKQQEFDRKEALLQKKYTEASMMPEIKENHAARGLSVVKGNANDELVWLFRSVYNPRFVDRKPITTRLVNKLKTDIIIAVKTKGKSVTSVTTRDLRRVTDGQAIPLFSHYHQQGHGDCWGTWRHPKTWNTPDDIIRMAKDAEAVLENVNTGSVANRSPNGMPRVQTLKDNIDTTRDRQRTVSVNERDIPAPELRPDDTDVWQSI